MPSQPAICQLVDDALADGGMLSPGLVAHCQTCKRCARRRAVSAAVDTALLRSPPARSDIMQAVRRRIVSWEQQRRRLSAAGWWPRLWTPEVAALVLWCALTGWCADRVTAASWAQVGEALRATGVSASAALAMRWAVLIDWLRAVAADYALPEVWSWPTSYRLMLPASVQWGLWAVIALLLAVALTRARVPARPKRAVWR